jgi:hypothetical protein
MADITVAIINASKTLEDGAVKKAIPALQKQVARDFAPQWGVAADLVFVAANAKPPAGSWWLVILDDSDAAGALGYHDVTVEGLPLGKVFAASDALYGLEWTVTASHELLEMLADPAINLTALVESEFDPAQNVVTRAYAYEVCDPCEADGDGYAIDGVLVSDFVYPSWFEPFRKKGTKFDHRGLIDAPLALRPDGYLSVLDISSGSGWQQIYVPPAQGKQRYGARAQVGSRRERRRIARGAWMRSAPGKTAPGQRKAAHA